MAITAGISYAVVDTTTVGATCDNTRIELINRLDNLHLDRGRDAGLDQGLGLEP